jgi:hypothetical protein
MKILTVVIALTTVFASQVHATTLQTRHTAQFVKHSRGHAAVARNSRVYLLENNGAGMTSQGRDFQDNFAIDY